MKDFIKRLSSRKFLVCVGGLAAVTIYPELAQPIVAICGIYAGAEGAADVVQRYLGGKTAVEEQQVIKAALESGMVPQGYQPQLVAGQPPAAAAGQQPGDRYIAGSPH